MMECIANFFTYETTKSVVVKSWTIGIINRVVQLLIIAYFVGWVFLHEKAYQTRDTAIESSVMTKVKGFGVYNNRVMDVADYVTPAQGASVFCIITKFITTDNQVQTSCPESETKYSCNSDDDCKRFMLKTSGNGVKTGRCVNYNGTLKTCEIRGWCPAEIDSVHSQPMLEAENFTIFIKNSIRFPLFNFTKGNLLPNITEKYIGTCLFDPRTDIYCPIFRLGDVVRFAGQDFKTLADRGGVIGIKIGWVCDLDKSDDQCNPAYSFTRLDSVSAKTKVSPGYNFRYAKYFKKADGTEHRTLLKAHAIRIDVLVYGNKHEGYGIQYCLNVNAGVRVNPMFTAGKFNMIPTLINIVAAFTSVGVGTVLCDIILLNFLKGAEQYKAKKFEEVTEHQIKSALSTSNELCKSNQTLSIKYDEKQSTDSGAYSIGQ